MRNATSPDRPKAGKEIESKGAALLIIATNRSGLGQIGFAALPMCARAGIDQSLLSKYIRGIRNPRDDNREAIAAAAASVRGVPQIPPKSWDQKAPKALVAEARLSQRSRPRATA